MAGSSPYPMACDLYGDIIDRPGHTWRSLLPGLVVVCMATLAAGFIADRYAMPLTLTALLTGLALNFLSADERLDAGLVAADDHPFQEGDTEHDGQAQRERDGGHPEEHLPPRGARLSELRGEVERPEERHRDDGGGQHDPQGFDRVATRDLPGAGGRSDDPHP